MTKLGYICTMKYANITHYVCRQFWWHGNVLVLQCLVKSNMKNYIQHKLSLSDRENDQRKDIKAFQKLLMVKSVTYYNLCFFPSLFFIILFQPPPFIQGNNHKCFFIGSQIEGELLLLILGRFLRIYVLFCPTSYSHRSFLFAVLVVNTGLKMKEAHLGQDSHLEKAESGQNSYNRVNTRYVVGQAYSS